MVCYIMKVELTNLLKFWRGFGFGNVKEEESIGRFSVYGVVDSKRTALSSYGVGEEDVRIYTIIDSAYRKLDLVRIRRGFFYNLLDNFKVRCDVRKEKFGQSCLRRDITLYG